VRTLVFCAVLLLAMQAQAQIPEVAGKWKHALTRQARLEWGSDAPIATIAAQIQQESSWNPDARSPVGALGMAQFMPATAVWISGAYSALAENDPLNPLWALRAVAAYDRILYDAVTARDECNRAAKMLSSYNGGLGWIKRDEALAKSRGLSPDLWWESVELVNSGRNAAAFRENRAYPLRILRYHERHYVLAGWGIGLCDEGNYK
jgi:soluble lytic murein transglycosylase-like protein